MRKFVIQVNEHFIATRPFLLSACFSPLNTGLWQFVLWCRVEKQPVVLVFLMLLTNPLFRGLKGRYGNPRLHRCSLNLLKRVRKTKVQVLMPIRSFSSKVCPSPCFFFNPPPESIGTPYIVMDVKPSASQPSPAGVITHRRNFNLFYDQETPLKPIDFGGADQEEK